MDWLICFKSHPSSECPKRVEQNCPDCHAYINVCSDHTSVCGMKKWQFKKYANLYVNRPKDRCVIFINVPFQFLMNGCWRKGTDGLDMYSPVTSAFFQYKSEDDLSLLSNSFVGVRIVVLIKDSTKFIQKLLLVTSKTLLIVAGQVDSEFNRNSANDRRTTLFLAMSAEDQRIININVFPKDKISHQYVLP